MARLGRRALHTLVVVCMTFTTLAGAVQPARATPAAA
jgi:hypothetical protein